MRTRRAGALAVWLTAASATGALLVLVLGTRWALHESERAVGRRRAALGVELRQAAPDLSARFISWRDGATLLDLPTGFAMRPVAYRPAPASVPGPACRTLLREAAAGPDGLPVLYQALAVDSFHADDRAWITRALVRRLPDEAGEDEAIPLLEEALTQVGLSAEPRLLLSFDLARRSPEHRDALLPVLLSTASDDQSFEQVAPGRRAALVRELLARDDPRRSGDALLALEFLDQALMDDAGIEVPVMSAADHRRVAWVHAPGPGRFEVVLGPAPALFSLLSPAVSAGRFAVDPDRGDARLADPLPSWFLKIGPAGERELHRLGLTQRLVRLTLVGGLALLLAAGGFLSFRALRRERVVQRDKASFVTTVTHELKTPLATIALCAETLREHGATDPEAIPRFSRMILDETERLRLRIQQILDVAAGRAPLHGTTSDFDPAGVVEAVVAEASPGAHEQGVQVDLVVADRRPRVRGSADLLAQAVNGVLENAIQFGGPGTVRVRARPDENQYLVSIADEGPGLSAEQRDRVFEPFVRLEPVMTRTVSGTGLGLTLVRQCVQGLGGEVQVQPRRPRGSVFVIRLPLAPEDRS